MNASEALKIIRPLAEGTDPFTGEVHSSDSPFQHPNMVRALYKAIEELEHRVRCERKRKEGPKRSGKPWTEDEDFKLLEGFENKMPLAAIAERHQRTQ